MKLYSGCLFACVTLASVVGIDGASYAHGEAYGLLASTTSTQASGQDNASPAPVGVQGRSGLGSPQPQTAVVLRFAVETQPVTDASALSAQACPQTNGDVASASTTNQTKPLTVDPKILDDITNELQKRLSKKMSVMVNPAPNSIPVGAMVISGCITKANGGNAAERLAGMNLGASHLGVHVVALSRTRAGWNPLDTFDIQVKGGDILPPLGPAALAVHAVRDTQQTLPADARKLADKVLKRLAKDVKAREQVAKG
jgi:hypothetical protein